MPKCPACHHPFLASEAVEGRCPACGQPLETAPPAVPPSTPALQRFDRDTWVPPNELSSTEQTAAGGVAPGQQTVDERSLPPALPVDPPPGPTAGMQTVQSDEIAAAATPPVGQPTIDMSAEAFLDLMEAAETAPGQQTVEIRPPDIAGNKTIEMTPDEVRAQQAALLGQGSTAPPALAGQQTVDDRMFADQAASAFDPDATPPQGMPIVRAEDLSPGAGLPGAKTVDMPRHPAEFLTGTGAKTVDLSAIGKTIDMSDMAANPFLSQGAGPTGVPPQGGMQPHGHGPQGAATITMRTGDQTVDLSALQHGGANVTVPGTIHAGPPGQGPSDSQTYGMGDLTPEEAGKVTRVWGATFDPNMPPSMSMRGEAPYVGRGTARGSKQRRSTQVVQPRNVRSLKEPGSSLVDISKLDYELLDVLGEGGMGVVYAARQASIDRTVALKMVKAEVADEEQRNKFLAEAVVTGELEHPNIVPIYDLGRNETGALFYAMKKVQGTPWLKAIHRKSQAENIEILMKVADAVAFAHSRGVLHRDLKPENVMLGEYGEVLVMDWGLAMPISGFRKASSVNLTIGMGGTPAYMAPEMATGPFERIGTASDVYLLGAILYEIITGQPPHIGRTTMHCLLAAGRNEITKTEKGGELLNIALKAMSTKPEDRYPGAIAFQNAIREYQSHSESISLTVRAEEDLAEAEKTNEYQRFARAVFGFEESLEMWPANHQARQGLSRSRRAYATSALAKGDYDLGLSLLDERDAEHAELRQQLTLAQAEREARQQRLKNIKRLVTAMAAMMVLIISIALGVTMHQRNRAVAAEKEAVEQKKKAVEQRDRAVLAEADAKEQRDIAVAAEKETKLQRDKAIAAEKEAKTQRDLAVKAEKEAVAQRDRAVVAEKDAKKQRDLAETKRKEAVAAQTLAEEKRKEAEMARKEAVAAKEMETVAKEKEAVQRKLAVEAKELAVKAKEEAEKAALAEKEAKEKEAVQRQLADDARLKAEQARKQEAVARRAAERAKRQAELAKEAEEYEGYIARVGLASAKIDENAFGHAQQLLEDCPPALRNWEWGRLMHLCGGSISDFPAEGPVDAVAYSPQGDRFVAGGWDGRARIWSTAAPKQPPLIIPYGGSYIHAVAFSPDGQRVATGGNDRRGFVRLWDASSGQLVQTFHGHEDSVLSVEFSRDGTRLLTSSYDKTIRIWDAATGKLLRTLTGHHWWVWQARFTADEKHVVSASQDGSAIVWPLEGSLPRSLPMFSAHGGPVYALAISPDGRTVASGGYDNRVLIWDIADVKPFDFQQLVDSGQTSSQPFRALEGHAGAVRAVQFSKNGKLLVTAGQDNTLKVWDFESGKVLKTLRGHDGWVRGCAFSPDGHSVLSGSHDKQVKIWSIEGYEEIRVLQGRVLEGHQEGVLSAVFSPDGEQVITASRDRTARLWDVATARELAILDEGHEFLASSAAFFGDGQRLATGAVDNTVSIWDVTTGTQLARLTGTGRGAAVSVSADGKLVATGGEDRVVRLWDGATYESIKELSGHPGDVTAVAFSPDGKLLLSGDSGGRCRLWNPRTGQLLHRLEGHTRKIVSVGFSADGKTALTASGDNTVGQWNVTTGQEIRDRVLRHPKPVRAAAVAPRGGLAVTCCDDGQVRVWDAAAARLLGTLDDPSQDVNAVAISADGTRALTACTTERIVRLWDLKTRKEIAAGEAGRAFLDFSGQAGVVWSAIFAPDGAGVLTVGGEGARLWQIESRQERMSFAPHGAVAAASFSPDGERIVTGSWDTSAKIWNLKTGRAEQKLVGGHTGYVNSAVFSRDGQQVLTGSDDRTARLWDLATGEVIRTFTGHTDRVRAAVFSPDGSRVLTASSDNTARVWDAASGECLQVLQANEYDVLSVAFSHDGRWVMTGDENNLAHVWDVENGTEMVRCAGHTAPVTSVAFSPDGQRALTGSRDNSAKLWDIAGAIRVDAQDALDAEVLVEEIEPADSEASAEEMADPVEAEAADQPSEETATDEDNQAAEEIEDPKNANEASADKTTNDATETSKTTGIGQAKEILTLAGHSQEVTSVSFSPDGRYVLSSSRDGTAFIWLAIPWESPLPTAEPPHTAQQDAN